MPEPTFTAGSVIALAAGSSVLAAVVTQAITAWRDSLKVKRDGTYSGLYLAAHLESYASLCATWLGESETHSTSGGHAGSAHGNVPELAPYSEDIDWKTLGVVAMDEALSFRVEVEFVQAMITDAWDVVGDEDFVLPEAFEWTAKLGKKALEIATRMRAAWKIPALKYPNTEWNAGTYLAERVSHYENLREKRAALNRKSWDELDAAVAANAIASPEPKTEP